MVFAKLMIFCSVLMLLACVSSNTVNYDNAGNLDANDTNIFRGMIYGNIQMEGGIREVKIRRLLVGGGISNESLISVRTFSNGNFIAENLQPGSYVITAVVSRSKIYNNFFGKNKSIYYAIHVGLGEFVYAGSYQVITSSHENNIYYISRSTKINEKEILNHLTKINIESSWYHPLVSRMHGLL